MSVLLTPEQEQEVAERVASGRYPTGQAVIREALAALREREEFEAKRSALIADVEEGIASLDAGEGIPLTRDTIEQIKVEGRKRQAKRGRVAHG